MHVYLYTYGLWLYVYKCLHMYDLPMIWLKMTHTNSRTPIIKCSVIFASLLSDSLKSVILGEYLPNRKEQILYRSENSPNNVFISLELFSSSFFSPQRVTTMRSSKSKSFQLLLNFIKMQYCLLCTWPSFFIISAMRFIHIDIGNCNITFFDVSHSNTWIYYHSCIYFVFRKFKTWHYYVQFYYKVQE